MNALITYGKFGRPHGTRGELRLWPYNPETSGLKPGTKLHVTTPEGTQTVVLRSTRKTDKCLLVTLEDIRFRDQIEALVNCECSVDRHDLPAPADDEFFHHDLVGLPVFVEGDPNPIGHVTSFLDLPSVYDVMSVEGPRIDGRLLVMWRDAIVLKVSLTEGITVAPLDTWAPEDFALRAT
jgi:16S rRNA processing protein RimM